MSVIKSRSELPVPLRDVPIVFETNTHIYYGRYDGMYHSVDLLLSGADPETSVMLVDREHVVRWGYLLDVWDAAIKSGSE